MTAAAYHCPGNVGQKACQPPRLKSSCLCICTLQTQKTGKNGDAESNSEHRHTGSTGQSDNKRLRGSCAQSQCWTRTVLEGVRRHHQVFETGRWVYFNTTYSDTSTKWKHKLPNFGDQYHCIFRKYPFSCLRRNWLNATPSATRILSSTRWRKVSPNWRDFVTRKYFPFCIRWRSPGNIDCRKK